MMRPFLPILAAVGLLLTAGAAVQSGKPRIPDPEQVAQQRIGEIVDAIVDANSGQPAPDIEEMAESLRRSIGRNRAQLLRQLWIYRATNPGNESAMSSALLLSYYEFTPSEMREALAPLLEARDATVRSSVLELLTSIDTAHGTRPDLSLYAGILGQHDQPPLGLVRYLYSLSPIDALTMTARRSMLHEDADVALRPALALESARKESDSGISSTRSTIRIPRCGSR